MRIAALYSHPTQYAVPLFRELSGRPGIDFTAYFLSRHGVEESFDPGFGRTFSWDLPMLEGYRYRFLPNLRREKTLEGFFQLTNVSAVGELRRGRYDALLVHGYEHLGKWFAFVGARLGGTRLVLRGESNLFTGARSAFGLAKRATFRHLFRSFHSFAYIGSLNRKYYESYGVEAGRLHFAPYSVDNDFFSDAAVRLRERRGELRREFGVSGDAPVVLFAGKLTERKRPELLLRAFEQVRARHQCHLLFAGDGELRRRLETLADEMRIPDVHFSGFLNQTDIPRAYAAADVFVLPSSYETWGLAVNEAMASGLPVITADRVGCSGDLIRDGVNGYVARGGAPAELADSMEKLVADPGLRKSCGKKSTEMIGAWSLARTADGIIEAAKERKGSDGI